MMKRRKKPVREKKEPWRLKAAQASELRTLRDAIWKTACYHKAWPLAESLLRPTFDAMLIYAANDEFANIRHQLEERIAELEFKQRRRPAAKRNKGKKK